MNEYSLAKVQEIYLFNTYIRLVINFLLDAIGLLKSIWSMPDYRFFFHSLYAFSMRCFSWLPIFLKLNFTPIVFSK